MRLLIEEIPMQRSIYIKHHKAGLRSIEISVSYTTNLGNSRLVVVNVITEDDPNGEINVSATGTLNADGIEALNKALTIAQAFVGSSVNLS